MINKDIEHCIELYKQGRYKIISEKIIDVDSHTVTKQIKKGRVILTCSCTNHRKFCNEQSFCRHKLFFILYPLLESLDGKISNLISEYQAGKSMMKTEEGKRLALQVVDDFKKLKEFN